MFHRHRRKLDHAARVLVAAIVALGLAACGSDDDENAATARNEGQAVEKAFLTGMVHHHETAIEMAEIAKRQGQDPFITDLADDILTTQEREIARMERIYERLLGGRLKPDAAAHDGLGLTAEEAGMTHSPETTEELRSADPFDRAFVDEMVPHHVGAIRMSDVVLKRTNDPALRSLAKGIVSTQQREVKAMNAFRTSEFGGPVPDGHRGEGKRSKKDKGHGADHSG